MNSACRSFIDGLRSVWNGGRKIKILFMDPGDKCDLRMNMFLKRLEVRYQ